jgi:hypothetical protein
MSDLKTTELRIIAEVLDMGSGFVLDFSDQTFSEFFETELRVDIDSDLWRANGDSKGKRLRAFLQLADNSIAARALRALADYRTALKDLRGTPATPDLDSRFQDIIARLEGAGGHASTDILDKFSADETLEELIGGIERDIMADRPQVALDRLHTYCMKKFAHVLATRRPGTQPASTLNARAGQVVNELKRDAKAHHPVSFEIMTSTVKIFEQFNDIRNNKSLAHDNTIIGKAEARFIFDGVANSLRFLKATEGQAFGP